MISLSSLLQQRAYSLLPLLLVTFLTACGGGGLDPVLGTPVAGIAPTVSATTPVTGPPMTTGVATNSRVFVRFSKAMAPATITPASVTLACPAGTPVAAGVTYDAGTRTATLAPAAPLPANTQCLATVTTAVQDDTGFSLNSPYSWSFTTAGGADATAPTVTSVSPVDTSNNVCLTQAVTVLFSEAMDPMTVTTANVVVSNGGMAVAGSVSYDDNSQTASFLPTNPAGFAANTAFVVTVRSGATGLRDIAGNPLAADQVSGFTTGAAACAPAVNPADPASPINLGRAAGFGAFGGGAGVTNQGINTVVGGDLGTTAACTLITGLHDAANVYTETPLNIGAVSGAVFCAPPAPGTLVSQGIALQARADALSAYNVLRSQPAGSDPGAGQLGGLVLAPGTYTAAGGTFAVTTGDLVLDAQGNANAVWIFQSAAALTVGLGATPRQVLLVNGARARNVFWQVGSAARIENGSSMVGTIIAPAGVTISTAGQTQQTTLTGRAIGLTASVTMVNTTIVAP
ncbi:MAG: ice-binding family protein [Burkholderiaceae bacterium]